MFEAMNVVYGSARRSVVATLAVWVVLLAMGPAVALAGSPEWLPNGSFEGTGSGSLKGWKATNARLSLAPDGVGGGYAAKAALTSTATSYQMYASPRPLTGASAGDLLTAGGMVRTDAPGRLVCLVVREFGADGSRVAAKQVCMKPSSTWSSFPSVAYTVRANGDSLAFNIRQGHAVAGDSFEVDNLTLTGTLTTQPTALWHMNETSGSTMFDSVGSANGTIHTVQLGVAGTQRTAFGFNGSSSYISIPSSPSISPGSADVSFTVAVKTGTLPTRGDYDLFRRGAYPGDFYKLEILQSGRAWCQFRGDANGHTTKGISGGPVLNDNRWHAITCARTATQVRLTVDGTTYTVTKRIGSITGTDPLIIGAHPNSDYFEGALDEASITIG